MNRYLLISTLTIFLLSGGIVLAAPLYTPLRSVIPEIDSTYYIGTSSPSNLRYNGVFNNVSITGTCTGCGSTSGYPFPLTGNATSTLTQFNGGLTSYATSTIGDGTQVGGLTISGGATTTGTAYFVGSVGIGVSKPTSLLHLNGGTTAAAGINLGDSSANLYRSAASTIRTDGQLITGGNMQNFGGQLLIRAASGFIGLASTGQVGFSSGSNDNIGTNDTALSRSSAGVFAVGNGTVGNTSGSIIMTSATTTNLGINSETFTDLTGTGLSNVGGVLTNSGLTSLTATYPILSSGGSTPTISTALVTTTSQTWAGTQTFTSSPVFSTIGAGTVNSTSGGKIYNTATTSLAFSAPFSVSGTLGALISGTDSTISCTNASSGVTGCLTGTDWNTFNGKQAAISAASSTVLYVNNATVTGNTRMVYTGTNLGLGTTTPGYKLGVIGNGHFGGLNSANRRLEFDVDGKLTFYSSDNNIVNGATFNNFAIDGGSQGLGFLFQLASSSNSCVGCDLRSAGITAISENALTSPSVQNVSLGFSTTAAGNYNFNMILKGNGNLGIGTTTPGSKLSVTSGASIGADYGKTAPTNGLIVEGSTGIGTTSPYATLSVVGSGNPVFAVATSTVTTGSSNPVFSIAPSGHVISYGKLPTLSSCGTSPSVVGNDADMIVTVGSVVATGCTITFANTWAATPTCNVTEQTGSITNIFSYTISTTAIVVTQTGLTGDLLNIMCHEPHS